MIYLDNNATTQIHPEVAAAMDECHRAGFANPASQHAAGRRARRALEEARTGIAEILGAKITGMDADRVIFTSGGTEANNLAIRGLACSNPASHASRVRHGEPAGRMVISAIEHPSVVAAAERMAAAGHELVRLPVDGNGAVRVDELPSLLTPHTQLVSLMLANNETGVLQPVSRAVEICREQAGKNDYRPLFVHTDAVQCVGKVPVHFRELGVDALTASAHKFHGPTGVGVLIVRHDVPLEPILFGGVQQASLRPGTESIPHAVGMHVALQVWQREHDGRKRRMTQLREMLEQELRRACPDVVINGEFAMRLPHTSNLAFRGLDRQALVMALDMAGVACSTGSACSSGSSEPSPVLLAMGVERAVVEGSIRLSLSAFTTDQDVLQAAQRISRIVNDLRHLRKSSPALPAPPKIAPTPV
jgi:cysteine desulfurase